MRARKSLSIDCENLSSCEPSYSENLIRSRSLLCGSTKPNQAVTPLVERCVPLMTRRVSLDLQTAVTFVLSQDSEEQDVSCTLFTALRLYVEEEDLQPTRALNRGQFDAFKSRRVAKISLIVEIPTKGQFQVSITDPVRPSLCKFSEKRNQTSFLSMEQAYVIAAFGDIITV